MCFVHSVSRRSICFAKLLSQTLLICLLLGGCQKGAREESTTEKVTESSASQNQLVSHDEISKLRNQVSETLSDKEIEELHPVVKSFCGDCHTYPEPETFPATVWREEVRNGFNFYLESGRSDLSPPPIDEVIQYH